MHAYVADFNLAFKAFDSYVELVQRGKQREEKSGKPDYSLDSDDNILQTASEAVRILCRFGARKDVEKALKISSELLQWVEKAALEAEARETEEVEKGIPIRVPVSMRVISEAYRALGTCEATWARWTYDASTRNTHQQKAVEYYRNALDIRYANGHDLETQFALAFVLAEMRELAPAINITKQALSRPSETQTFPTYLTNGNAPEHFQRDGSSDFGRERKLIPFWHLLTLLLSAKADMSTAARSSNAAFEQFEDPTHLFGPEKIFKSEHLNELEKPETARSKALIDKMERHEKEGIVQVKMTQIAILEELQSSADAVDASAELLALFARMFGDPKGDLLRSQARAATAKPPRSAVGSIRHSLMSRARSRSRRGKSVSSIVPPLPSLEVRPSTRATSITTAPTIQITADDGSTTRGRRAHSNTHSNVHHHSILRSKSQNAGSEMPQRSPSHKLQKRSASQSKQNSFESHRSTAPATAEESIVADYANGTPNPVESRPRASSASRPGTANSDSNTARINEEHSMPSFAGRISTSTSRRTSANRGTPTKRVGIAPAPFSSTDSITPEPVFSVFQERKHRITLLIQVWLFVAGLYTRAEVFDDATGAIDEAEDLVQALESQVAQQDSSVKAFAARGWGGGKSVEELWADIWAQVRLISGKLTQLANVTKARSSRSKSRLSTRSNVTLRKSRRTSSRPPSCSCRPLRYSARHLLPEAITRTNPTSHLRHIRFLHLFDTVLRTPQLESIPSPFNQSNIHRFIPNLNPLKSYPRPLPPNNNKFNNPPRFTPLHQKTLPIGFGYPKRHHINFTPQFQPHTRRTQPSRSARSSIRLVKHIDQVGKRMGLQRGLVFVGEGL